VLDLIRNHLEMSAALRRDVFDEETIRSFAARVPNPELLRMLTLFTYADINAVHPDALTPWKAENLWRLYNATANYLDRNVDDERVAVDSTGELMHRIHALLPDSKATVNAFLEGFPQRYLQTRTPDVVRKHIEMASRLERNPDGIELDFRYAPGVSELTLITRDRPMLFAAIAGALAGWGMNIVTADAFSDAQGLVVDSFRFSDSFRTLELNEPERERFLLSVADLLAGKADLEALLASRRRGRRKLAKMQVEPRVDFDDCASGHSTLMQVVAQDTPGLLRALSLTLAEQGCNIEVALVDTEGETAIDVFYVTRAGGKLDGAQQAALRLALLEAIERNAR
jgi:[protein-PII] uridylyltransferase